MCMCVCVECNIVTSNSSRTILLPLKYKFKGRNPRKLKYNTILKFISTKT